MRPGTTTIPRTRRCAEARWTTGSTAAVTVGATNVAANRRSRQCSSRDHGQRPRRELMRPVKIRSTGTQVGRAATCAAQPLLSAGSAPDGAGTHASVGARLEQHRAGSIRTDVRPSIHRPSMRYLMLMWADADATSGNESDLQAWLDFDERVKANGAFVVTEHSPPPRPMLASCKPRQLGTRSTGRWNADRSPTATGRFRPSTSWISPTWTPPSSGRTSCQPTATLRSASCCSSDQSFVVPAGHCRPSRPRPAHIKVARRCATS